MDADRLVANRSPMPARERVAVGPHRRLRPRFSRACAQHRRRPAQRAARAARRVNRRARAVGDGRVFRGPGGHGRSAQRRLAAHGRPRLHRGRRAVRLRADQGPDHPPGPQVSPAGSRVGDRRCPRHPLAGVVVFGINQLEEADEVVAVSKPGPAPRRTTSIDHVRRRVRETAGLELDRVVVAPPGTIPRTTSGKVRRAETRARFQAGTLLQSGRERLRPWLCSTSCKPIAERIAVLGDGPVPFDTVIDEVLRSDRGRDRRTPHADVRVEQLLRSELSSRRHRRRARGARSRRRRHDRDRARPTAPSPPTAGSNRPSRTSTASATRWSSRPVTRRTSA